MSNPRWLEPLPDAALMRATDAWAIEEKQVPSLELMERAGEGLARVIAEHVPAGRIAVVCGKGNNGGDGLVAARLLRAAGRDVEVHLVWEAQWLSDDAKAMLAKLPGPAPVAYDAAALGRAHGIVDALLGTGTAGAPKDPVAGVIADINGARGRTIAADVPSGIDASTGEVAGRGDPRRRHRRVPRRQARALDRTGQGTRRRGRGRGHRHPARRARRRRRRPSSTPACCGTSPAAAPPRPSSPPATWSSSAARAG